MTKYANRKQAAREYAATHGISYTTALRALEEQQQPAAANPTDRFTDLLAAIGGQMPALYVLQQAEMPNGVLPYEFGVSASGFVRNQRHWRGQPLRLVGFEDRTPEAFARNASTGGHNIALYRHEFIDNPEAAVGLSPVFQDVDGTTVRQVTYSGNIETVRVDHIMPSESALPVVATCASLTPRATEVVEFDASGWLYAYPDTLLRTLLSTSIPALDGEQVNFLGSCLWWEAEDGNAEAREFYDDIAEAIENSPETTADSDWFTISFNQEQLAEWLRHNRGAQQVKAGVR